jgi:hypothetical protein
MSPAENTVRVESEVFTATAKRPWVNTCVQTLVPWRLQTRLR